MNYRKAALGLSIAVTTLALIVWQMRPQNAALKTEAINSDYRLQNFTMMAFNEQGEENFSLSAPLLERDPSGKTISIQQPHFSFPNHQQGTWQAQANAALVLDKAHEIQLNHAVRVWGPPSPRGLSTQFNSEQLTFWPKQNRLFSSQWVTIQHGKTILKGQGLEANMKQHRVQLLANVQAHYAPNTH